MSSVVIGVGVESHIASAGGDRQVKGLDLRKPIAPGVLHQLRIVPRVGFEREDAALRANEALQEGPAVAHVRSDIDEVVNPAARARTSEPETSGSYGPVAKWLHMTWEV